MEKGNAAQPEIFIVDEGVQARDQGRGAANQIAYPLGQAVHGIPPGLGGGQGQESVEVGAGQAPRVAGQEVAGDVLEFPYRFGPQGMGGNQGQPGPGLDEGKRELAADGGRYAEKREAALHVGRYADGARSVGMGGQGPAHGGDENPGVQCFRHARGRRRAPPTSGW